MAWTAVVVPSLAPSASIVTRAGIPTSPTDTDHGAAADGDVSYRLQASCPLPRIDCVSTIKTHVLRNPRHLQHFDRLSHHGKPLINASLAVGCLTTWVWMATDAETSRILAVVTYVCFCPPLVTGFLAMRTDIIKLLLQTYEFWYITLNSAASAMLLCIYLQDATRALLPVIAFVWYVRASLVDANCSSARSTARILAMGAVSVAIFMVGVVLELMPATRAFVLFETNGHVLSSDDVALNGLGIVLLLLARNAYRKYSTAPRRKLAETGNASSSSTGVARVRLIGYRTRIRFVECHGTAVPQAAPRGEATEPRTASLDPSTPDHNSHQRLSQLVFVAPATTFHARCVLWPVAFDALSLSWGNLPLWVLSRVAVAVGIVAAVLPFTPGYRIASVICTTLYCGLSLALCNRAMLRLLVQSFDVQFLFMQHAMAHLTAGYILYWESRSLLTLASWIWIVWLLTIDALTPVAKRKLHISRRFLILIFVKLLLEQAAFCVSFTYLPFDNRTILSVRVTKQHGLVLKAIPFFLTRLLSMFWWTWRLLWRVCTQDTSELVVIQGGVDFEDYKLHQKFVKRQSQGGRADRRTHTQRVVVVSANSSNSSSQPPTSR